LSAFSNSLGTEIPDAKLLLITDRELFNKRQKDVPTGRKRHYKERAEYIENITRTEAIEDARTLLELADLVLESGIAEQALTDVKSVELDFAVIEEILVKVEELNIVNNNFAKLAELAVNFVLAMFSEVRAEEGLYEGVSFEHEIEIFINSPVNFSRLATLFKSFTMSVAWTSVSVVIHPAFAVQNLPSTLPLM
jgi:hypothetical protein